MKTFRIGKMKNKEIGMRELEYIHVKMKVFLKQSEQQKNQTVDEDQR